MRHLVIGQRQKAPNFSAFHWSPHGCLITIGQHFVTTRVVRLPKRTETSLITEVELITSCCSYARSAQPGPIRTRLCGPCIAAKAGSFSALSLDDKLLHMYEKLNSLEKINKSIESIAICVTQTSSKVDHMNMHVDNHEQFFKLLARLLLTVINK